MIHSLSFFLKPDLFVTFQTSDMMDESQLDYIDI